MCQHSSCPHWHVFQTIAGNTSPSTKPPFGSKIEEWTCLLIWVSRPADWSHSDRQVRGGYLLIRRHKKSVHSRVLLESSCRCLTVLLQLNYYSVDQGISPYTERQNWKWQIFSILWCTSKWKCWVRSWFCALVFHWISRCGRGTQN